MKCFFLKNGGSSRGDFPLKQPHFFPHIALLMLVPCVAHFQYQNVKLVACFRPRHLLIGPSMQICHKKGHFQDQKQASLLQVLLVKVRKNAFCLIFSLLRFASLFSGLLSFFSTKAQCSKIARIFPFECQVKLIAYLYTGT